ncbi:hypothetical protein OG252_50300 [Streptomyces sp. NBC_01352]|nr:hypothetical protein [Streptomyces sp. NBC_01352]
MCAYDVEYGGVCVEAAAQQRRVGFGEAELVAGDGEVAPPGELDGESREPFRRPVGGPDAAGVPGLHEAHKRVGEFGDGSGGVVAVVEQDVDGLDGEVVQRGPYVLVHSGTAQRDVRAGGVVSEPW